MPPASKPTQFPPRPRLAISSLFSIAIGLALFPLLGSKLQGSSSQEETRRFSQSQIHMGVKFTILVYAADPELAQQGLDEAFAKIEELDELLSNYDPESPLSQLGVSSPHQTPVTIAPDFCELLKESQQVSQQSVGAFDLTVGPLTDLWRKARRSGELPPADVLQEARAATGFRFIELDTNTSSVRLTRPNMKLDPGGIAKGFAADKALQVLKKNGLTRALIDASGDVVVGDPPPERTGWVIGVAPLDPKTPPSRTLTIANQSVATSGDAWQAIEIDGKRYSHIIDPKTGLGLTQRSSVTVLAKNGTLADAWASAVSVLGPQKGIEMIEQQKGIEALIVTVEDGQPQVVTSSGFPAGEQQSDQ